MLPTSSVCAKHTKNDTILNITLIFIYLFNTLLSFLKDVKLRPRFNCSLLINRKKRYITKH